MIAVTFGLAALGTAAQANTPTIVDEWASIKAPAAPELKSVTLDPKTTTLLVLDFVSLNCASRPRCMATLPAMKKLLAEARAKGMVVVFATGPTEQFVAVHMITAPLVSRNVTLTKLDLIKL